MIVLEQSKTYADTISGLILAKDLTSASSAGKASRSLAQWQYTKDYTPVKDHTNAICATKRLCPGLPC